MGTKQKRRIARLEREVAHSKRRLANNELFIFYKGRELGAAIAEIEAKDRHIEYLYQGIGFQQLPIEIDRLAGGMMSTAPRRRPQGEEIILPCAPFPPRTSCPPESPTREGMRMIRLRFGRMVLAHGRSRTDYYGWHLPPGVFLIDPRIPQ